MDVTTIEQFDWTEYEDNYRGGNRLIPNQKIKGQDNKNICFSRASNAQTLFDLYTAKNSKTIKKDLDKGDCVVITDIYNVHSDKMTIELTGGLSVDIDLAREKRFLQLFGYDTVDKFVSDLLTRGFVEKRALARQTRRENCLPRP